MPPPYLVDIDGHPHPLKGQNGILELIRPASNMECNKKEEEENVLVDYDEFMKQRQVQLVAKNKQFSKVTTKCLLKNGMDSRVHQNNRDASYDDQPCCSSSTGSQTFIQSLDSSIAMETDQTIMHKSKNQDHSELTNGSLNDAGISMKIDHSVANGHSIPTGEQQKATFDHQDGANFDHVVDNCEQSGHLNDQAVINDQAIINDQALINDQAFVNDLLSANGGIDVDNNQQQVNGQSSVNNQSPDNNRLVENSDEQGNDEINIIEFDNSNEAPGDINNNVLTSIVWSCGLSDQEAKNAVSLWLSRTIIPYLDAEGWG